MKSKAYLFFLGIVILYFILRLPNLTLQPIFADEAIYIRWAQIMRAEPNLRFLPLSDGKTPLFMWSMIPLFKIFSDPLFAGRFLSVMSGFLTLLGVFFLAKKIFNFRIALWAALLYTVVPYAVFFDRLALVDSMLAAFSVWSLYLAMWLIKKPRLDLAMILGYLLGGGLLTKTPAMVNLLILPVTIWGLDFAKARRMVAKILIFWLVALGIALGMYNLLRLGPEFQQLSLRNNDYMFSLVEVLRHPLDPFVPHLRDVGDFATRLLTWPIFLLTVWGIILIFLKRPRLALVILFWGMFPLLLQMVILKTFTARYLLFSLPPFLIIAAWGLENLLKLINLKKPVLISSTIMVLMILPLRFDYLLLTAPDRADLPSGERRGYLEEWTAGYGLKEIAQFLIAQKKNGSVAVGTEGFFGTLPDGLYIYLDKADISVIGGNATISSQLRSAAKANQTFFVANKNRVWENLPGVTLIKKYPKAKPLNPKFEQDAILLYKLIP